MSHELVHAWHDFYLLIGTAAATLIGLMFVAVSVGQKYLTERHEAAVQSFFTPTVFHFAAVLLICVLMLAPIAAMFIAALLLLIGITGAAYASLVWVRMGKHALTATIELPDRLWYGLGPVAGHLVAATGAVILLARKEYGLDVLAVGVILLLAVGIRNAWDITSWMAMRTDPSDAS